MQVKFTLKLCNSQNLKSCSDFTLEMIEMLLLLIIQKNISDLKEKIAANARKYQINFYKYMSNLVIISKILKMLSTIKQFCCTSVRPLAKSKL